MSMDGVGWRYFVSFVICYFSLLVRTWKHCAGDTHGTRCVPFSLPTIIVILICLFSASTFCNVNIFGLMSLSNVHFK
ncbi:hypothetical protein C8J57DRAFT_1355404 [Mycena rebaudengoi]|nr:hypothetical protein C8J57DRAFT_1355404 [Mycena rebaudengoi]